MKNKVKPNYTDYLIGFFFNPYTIITVIISFFLAPILIIVFPIFIYKIRQGIRSKYILAISSAYRWSIRAALETEHPEGIIYIIGNILQELEKFSINNQPSKYSYSNSESWSNEQGYSTSKSTSDVRGFPNKTNLKATIHQAEDLSQEWRRLNNVERINAMLKIWEMIEKEDMWLDWTVMRVNSGKKIYWYSYDESDYETIIQQHSNTISTGQEQKELTSSTQPVFNSQTSINSSKKILSFDDFLQKNPELFYHSEREQREEYHKYLASMGVTPRSSQTGSSYQKDNVQNDREQDDSVW